MLLLLLLLLLIEACCGEETSFELVEVLRMDKGRSLL